MIILIQLFYAPGVISTLSFGLHPDHDPPTCLYLAHAILILLRSVTAAGKRLRSARWPNFLPESPALGGWLFVNTSTFLGNNTFVIGLDEASLPPFALKPGWKGATVTIFPTRSWINLVRVTIRPYAQDDDADVRGTTNGLRHFLVRCPGHADAVHLCTNTSNSAAIGPGNRFFFEGDAAALSIGEWHYEYDTGVLAIASISRPSGVVIPKAAAVVTLDSPPLPPAPHTCKFNATVKGRSPGSAIRWWWWWWWWW